MAQELPEMRNGEPSSMVGFVFIKGTSLAELEGNAKAPAVLGVKKHDEVFA